MASGPGRSVHRSPVWVGGSRDGSRSTVHRSPGWVAGIRLLARSTEPDRIIRAGVGGCVRRAAICPRLRAVLEKVFPAAQQVGGLRLENIPCFRQNKWCPVRSGCVRGGLGQVFVDFRDFDLGLLGNGENVEKWLGKFMVIFKINSKRDYVGAGVVGALPGLGFRVVADWTGFACVDKKKPPSASERCGIHRVVLFE